MSTKPVGRSRRPEPPRPDRRPAVQPGPLVRPRRSLRVVLIQPPAITAPRSLSYYGAVPSLGLAYVAAAIREVGHEVAVVDAPGLAIERFVPMHTAAGSVLVQGLSIEEIASRVAADTEVIGIAHMFVHEWPLLRRLIARLRKRCPDALIVAGGENASAFWDHMLEACPELDACVLGEGEATMTALLAAQADGKPIATVSGLAIRGKTGPVRTANPTRVTAVDALPWPAWDLFPLQAYLDHGYGSGVDRGRALPILTSRGCPYQCTFCSSPQMWTTRYVRRSPHDVVDEIEHNAARYGVANVNINDLTSLLTKDWIVEFCEVLIARGVEVTWQLPSGTRSEAVDEQAAELLYAAGCRNFCYAPESGSASELRRIKKRVSLPALVDSLRGCLRAGLTTQASLIIGFPDQRAADLWQTFRFSQRLATLGLHALGVLVFAPYPGSEEYRRLRAAGRIRFDDRYLYSSLLRSAGAQRSYHRWLGPRTLGAMQMGFLLGFFATQYLTRPRRLLDVVRAAATGRQQTPVDQFFAVKIGQARRWLARVSPGPA